jgi:hypothetical protein
MTGIDERQEALLQLLTDVDGGVLATFKNDEWPQLSNVIHTYSKYSKYSSERRIIRVSVLHDHVRPCNLWSDPHSGASTQLRAKRAYRQRRQHS